MLVIIYKMHCPLVGIDIPMRKRLQNVEILWFLQLENTVRFGLVI